MPGGFFGYILFSQWENLWSYIPFFSSFSLACATGDGAKQDNNLSVVKSQDMAGTKTQNKLTSAKSQNHYNLKAKRKEANRNVAQVN